MLDYSKIINSNIQNVKPSGIRKFFDIANEMKDVISLSIGEPDFKTPWHIRQVGIDSLNQGKTWYTPNKGFIKLRDEIERYYKRRFSVDYDSKKEIIVTVGGSEAIDLALRCLVGKGDEVLIPEPCFVCYNPLTEMTGATPVKISTKMENHFRITAEEIEQAVTPRTKLIILPYPNNPTGAIMTKQDLESISKVIIKHNLMVISDEIYAELTYSNEGHTSVGSIDGMRERTIIVSGFSKAYAMTGWRLGYALGPDPIIAQMTKLHQFSIMSAPTTAQYAAIEALKNGDSDIQMMREQYNMRRRLLVKGFENIGLSCFEPLGAFYAFPCIKSTGLSSDEFCEKLLHSKHVAVVPGTAFGESGEGFVRVSYSYSLQHLTEALSRIEEFLEEIKK